MNRKKRTAYRSGFESRVARALKKAKISFSFESESLEYSVLKKYIPDFVIKRCRGKGRESSFIYVECKGWFKPSDRTKMLLVKKQHPNLDIRLWFQQDNYLTKNKKLKYSDWAEKNGFECHIGEDVPSWFGKNST